MSLFANPDKKLVDAIKWFNALKDEQRTQIFTALDGNSTRFTPEQTDNLTVLALEILTATPTYQPTQIAQRLQQLGLKDLYAMFLVDKVLKNKSLLGLDISRLLSFDEQKFEKAIETVIVKFYVENNSLDFLLAYGSLTNDEFDAAFRFIRDYLLFKFIRGDISTEVLRQDLEGNLNFPRKRVDKIIELLEENKLTIMNNFIFRNTQDTYFMVQRLVNSQDQMLALLRELVEQLKKLAGQDKPSEKGNLYG